MFFGTKLCHKRGVGNKTILLRSREVRDAESILQLTFLPRALDPTALQCSAFSRLCLMAENHSQDQPIGHLRRSTGEKCAYVLPSAITRPFVTCSPASTPDRMKTWHLTCDRISAVKNIRRK